MSVLGKIKAFWKSLWSRSTSHRELAALLAHGTGLGTYSGAWTDSRIELVRHFRHWVYVAVDRIASQVAKQVPNVSLVGADTSPEDWQKHMDRERSARSILAAYERSKALTPLLSHEKLRPVRDDHPLCRLLRDPNDPDTQYDLWYETVLFLLITGSAYWWMPKNELTGLPAAVWVVPSHWVWPVVGDDRLISGYEIRPVEGNYLRQFIPHDQMLHFKKKGPISKIDGYSPLTAVNNWIDVQESIDKTRLFSFRQGTFPTVAIQFNGQLQDLTSEKLNEIEAKFFARYQGETRANKPLFVPPDYKVQKLHVTPLEMGFCESADQSRDNILAAFGVPAVVAQINTQMTYGSVIAAQAGFCTFTINPLCRFLGQAITEKLAWRYDKRIRVWWEDCTPDDPELVEKRILTDLQGGAIVPNEQRAMRGRAPYPNGGNDPLVPSNLTIVPFVTGGKPIPLAGYGQKGDAATPEDHQADEK